MVSLNKPFSFFGNQIQQLGT
uniref:Uncharacterized protein n=1 Tax=Rhizophora mucronata TaxID=61149 RepID=A0A2P2IZM5_RHIMU